MKLFGLAKIEKMREIKKEGERERKREMRERERETETERERDSDRSRESVQKLLGLPSLIVSL